MATKGTFEVYVDILKTKLQDIRKLFQECITDRKIFTYTTLWDKLYEGKDLPSDSDTTDDAGFKKAYEDLQRYVYYIFLTAPYKKVTLGEQIVYEYKNKEDMDELLKNGPKTVINDVEWEKALKEGGKLHTGSDFIWDGSKKQKKLKSKSPRKRKIKRSRSKTRKKM